jgi:lactate dehydrogenase-like 2-hydroxyacid dehydrogenase
MPDPTIIVTRRWPEAVEEKLLARFPDVRLNQDDCALGADGLRNALREADIVLPTVSDRLCEDVFDTELRCRFLGNFGVGYSHIDISSAIKHGIVVTNTPGVLTDTTADTAMTLMLMAARRAGEGERELRDGRWSGWRPTHLMGAEVTGKTLGIVGMGRIGQAVARRAHFGFGMPIAFFNPHDVTDHGIPGAQQLKTVEDVLAQADFVSLHLPGGGENTHLIDERRLAVMKRSAFLVNTARGDVVDQTALVAALRVGGIAGAALDVFENEPDVPGELRELDNVVLLPHLGSATLETRTAMGMLVLENLEAYLDGREPQCRVA